MTIQMQEEQKCSSCFLTELQQWAVRGDSMAKFLNYEVRLEIESGLKEHMTFTELGEKLGRDRTTTVSYTHLDKRFSSLCSAISGFLE